MNTPELLALAWVFGMIASAVAIAVILLHREPDREPEEADEPYDGLGAGP